MHINSSIFLLQTYRCDKNWKNASVKNAPVLNICYRLVYQATVYEYMALMEGKEIVWPLLLLLPPLQNLSPCSLIYVYCIFIVPRYPGFWSRPFAGYIYGSGFGDCFLRDGSSSCSCSSSDSDSRRHNFFKTTVLKKCNTCSVQFFYCNFFMAHREL